MNDRLYEEQIKLLYEFKANKRSAEKTLQWILKCGPRKPDVGPGKTPKLADAAAANAREASVYYDGPARQEPELPVAAAGALPYGPLVPKVLYALASTQCGLCRREPMVLDAAGLPTAPHVVDAATGRVLTNLPYFHLTKNESMVVHRGVPPGGTMMVKCPASSLWWAIQRARDKGWM